MSLMEGFINSGDCPESKQEEPSPGSIKRVTQLKAMVVWLWGNQLPGCAQLL